MKLNTLATKQGYDIQELQTQFYARHKKEIIIGIAVLIVVFLILIKLIF